MELNNDTIYFSYYHNIRNCLYTDFINSLKIFNYYFVYSFDKKEYIVKVKQTKKTDKQIVHCYFDFYTELINILKGGNCQTVFKKNQEWQYDLENRFYHPVNGIYNNCNRILKGKYKKAKRTGLWHIRREIYVYKKGEIIEEQIYYENGFLWEKTKFYSNGNLKLKTDYYDNGQKKTIKKYRRNPKTTYEIIYDKGINFKENKNNLKKYYEFSDNGKLIKREKYKKTTANNK